ncbi:MAG TPA: NAD(+) synthase [Candidatus Poseidoniaceae archaeon]|nr:NAD(+) synthase [Candidatus Poseidoniaceae archaeon]
MGDFNNLSKDIVDWIRKYANDNNINTLVVGVSGGIDSAVTSTLCSKTGLRTVVLNMPIHQEEIQYNLANNHIEWLKSNWENVESHMIDLTGTFDFLSKNDLKNQKLSNLALANTRARIRMTTLYAIAGSNNGIVVGTGNKVEDFGVGFFTKYGDGGVDISPIADLFKSEVYALADVLGIIQDIQDAAPTDGLWGDGRTDEEQMGATYDELEWAMKEVECPSEEELSKRQKEVLKLYLNLNKLNSHKMQTIPVFRNKDRDSMEE